MKMTRKLALEAYSLVDRLDSLSWNFAKSQDSKNYERVQRVWHKALTRYQRRYDQLKKTDSSLST